MKWLLRPLCWVLGHVQRWSIDDADTHCRRCGLCLCGHGEARPSDTHCPTCGEKLWKPQE